MGCDVPSWTPVGLHPSGVSVGVCPCVCVFFSFFIVKSAPGFCVAGTFTSQAWSPCDCMPPHTHTHTHTHLMLQWRCLYCRNARRCCVFVHVCVCLSREWSKTHREYPPPPPHPPSLLAFSLWSGVGWDKACYKNTLSRRVVGAGRSRISDVCRGNPWCERVQGEKNKRMCVCVRVCVSGLFNWTLAGQSSFLSAFVRERLCDHSRRRVHCEREAVPGNVHLNQGERSHKYRVHRGDEDSAPCRTKSAHK